MIRTVETEADFAGSVAVWNAITPREQTSVEAMRERWARQPERLYVVAEDGGRIVGTGMVAPSDTPGRLFLAVRVLREARRRGIGNAIYDRIEPHALSLRPRSLSTHVSAADADGIRFAEERGYVEVAHQVELVRALAGDEPYPEPPAGIEIAELREHMREAAYEVTKQAWEDMPLPDATPVPAWDDWVREEFDGPIAFAALENGRVVGYAALIGDRPDLLEHGLTACLRSHRGRGVGTALKQTQIAWAARNGYRELITFTQDRNAAMQAVNRKLGYVEQPAWLTMRKTLS